MKASKSSKSPAKRGQDKRHTAAAADPKVTVNKSAKALTLGGAVTVGQAKIEGRTRHDLNALAHVPVVVDRGPPPPLPQPIASFNF